MGKIINISLLLIIGLRFLGVQHLFADDSKLTTMHESCMADSGCKSYEPQAVQTFWGDASFMTQCVSSDKPIPPKFTIFFTIDSSGAFGKIELLPVTEVGKCILSHVANRRFKGAPEKFVARIDMTFEP